MNSADKLRAIVKKGLEGFMKETGLRPKVLEINYHNTDEYDSLPIEEKFKLGRSTEGDREIYSIEIVFQQ